MEKAEIQCRIVLGHNIGIGVKATSSINQRQHPTTSSDFLPLGFEATGHSTGGNASPTGHWLQTFRSLGYPGIGKYLPHGQKQATGCPAGTVEYTGAGKHCIQMVPTVEHLRYLSNVLHFT